MFLGKLSKEKKEMFLQLSIHAALSNKDLAEKEKLMIHGYCEELGIEEYEIKVKTDLDKLLEDIKENSTEEEKNIIIFEIAALVMSDNEYDPLEQEFMNTLKDKLEVSNDKVERMFELIKKLMDVYKGITEVILP